MFPSTWEIPLTYGSVLYRVVISLTQKPFGGLCQVDHMLALRVVTARVRYVLSGCFTSPNRIGDGNAISMWSSKPHEGLLNHLQTSKKRQHLINIYF